MGVKVRNIKAVAPFKGYSVAKISFEEVGAQINLEFDRRSGPRCPGCDSRLARNKSGRRAVMDSPMSHGPVVMLTFPTVQGMAEASGLAPFRRLARGLLKQSARVCGFVKHCLSSGLIEGFNNLIARIIHKACGMKDLDYLELKLRHRSVMRA